MRVARHHQLPVGRDQDDVVSTVKPFRDPAENPDPVGLLVFGLELVGQRMHDDFGVGVTLQVVITLAEQLLFELLIIGELPVEGEREPFRFAAVVAFEWLGVVSVVAPAGGITHVADRDRPVHSAHDRLEFLAMIEPERLGDRAHLFVGVDERIAVGTKAGHAGGELSPVLHVEQHPGYEPAHAVDVARYRSE